MTESVETSRVTVETIISDYWEQKKLSQEENDRLSMEDLERGELDS